MKALSHAKADSPPRVKEKPPHARLLYDNLGRMKKMSLKMDPEELKIPPQTKPKISKARAFLMKPIPR